MTAKVGEWSRRGTEERVRYLEGTSCTMLGGVVYNFPLRSAAESVIFSMVWQCAQVRGGMAIPNYVMQAYTASSPRTVRRAIRRLEERGLVTTGPAAPGGSPMISLGAEAVSRAHDRGIAITERAELGPRNVPEWLEGVDPLSIQNHAWAKAEGRQSDPSLKGREDDREGQEGPSCDGMNVTEGQNGPRVTSTCDEGADLAAPNNGLRGRRGQRGPGRSIKTADGKSFWIPRGLPEEYVRTLTDEIQKNSCSFGETTCKTQENAETPITIVAPSETPEERATSTPTHTLDRSDWDRLAGKAAEGEVQKGGHGHGSARGAASMARGRADEGDPDLGNSSSLGDVLGGLLLGLAPKGPGCKGGADVKQAVSEVANPKAVACRAAVPSVGDSRRDGSGPAGDSTCTPPTTPVAPEAEPSRSDAALRRRGGGDRTVWKFTDPKYEREYDLVRQVLPTTKSCVWGKEHYQMLREMGWTCEEIVSATRSWRRDFVAAHPDWDKKYYPRAKKILDPENEEGIMPYLRRLRPDMPKPKRSHIPKPPTEFQLRGFAAGTMAEAAALNDIAISATDRRERRAASRELSKWMARHHDEVLAAWNEERMGVVSHA